MNELLIVAMPVKYRTTKLNTENDKLPESGIKF